jgi:RNA-binding protein 23/39
MDVEAPVEAHVTKNGENGHAESPRERFLPNLNSDTDVFRVRSSSKTHPRSPTPGSDYSRHSSRHRKDHDRHRDRDDRDDSRYRRDHEYRSDSRSRHRDERYSSDRDRHESRRSEDRYRDRDDRYRDDRSDRRRSRYGDDYNDDRSSKRRREYDDREPSRPVDDRNGEKSFHRDEPVQSARYFETATAVDYRDPSPVLTEEERDQRTIFVQQLASRLRTKELIKFFEQAGPVREAQIVKDRVSGRSKGYILSVFKLMIGWVMLNFVIQVLSPKRSV